MLLFECKLQFSERTQFVVNRCLLFLWRATATVTVCRIATSMVRFVLCLSVCLSL